MTVNELRDSVFENYYKRIAFVNKSSYDSLKCSRKKMLLPATKLKEKIANPSNAKEYYNSYLKRKNKKVSKTIKND